MALSIERKFSGHLLKRLVVISVLASFGYRVCAQPSPDPDATVAQIMKTAVAPAANDLWNAVSIDVIADSEVEKGPETDEDWAKLRATAEGLAESADLMLTPGRAIDLPGKETPDYVLSPEQIQALMTSNWADWERHSKALRSVATHMIELIDKRDTSGLINAGDDLNSSCEGCHQQFWYAD